MGARNARFVHSRPPGDAGGKLRYEKEGWREGGREDRREVCVSGRGGHRERGRRRGREANDAAAYHTVRDSAKV